VSANIVKRDMGNTFKCAASVAPVTNFLFYGGFSYCFHISGSFKFSFPCFADAAYTERFMGLNSTTDNYEGYQVEFNLFGYVDLLTRLGVL